MFCTFNSNLKFEDVYMNVHYDERNLYQICSCGKHIWSCRARKIIKAKDIIRLSSSKYKNYRYYIFKKINKYRSLNIKKCFFFFFFLAIVVFYHKK